MRIVGETEYTIDCKNCDAKIVYFEHEIKRDILPPCCEELYWCYITCPRCKKEVFIRKE